MSSDEFGGFPDAIVREHTTEEGVRQTAVFSSCMKYRYALGRMWTPVERHDPTQVLVVIGLNPSTATEQVDDPTIRRCIDYAERWGHHGLTMLNLFAYRATDPKELYRALDRGEDIIGGVRQEAALKTLTGNGRTVLCAWGVHGAINARGWDVMQMLGELGRKMVCLGTTQSGAPKHPLYLKADLLPTQFP